MRKQPIALAENVYGRFVRAMQQELGSPIEEIGFAWVQLRRLLVLVDGFERIAPLLFYVAEQVTKFRLLLC